MDGNIPKNGKFFLGHTFFLIRSRFFFCDNMRILILINKTKNEKYYFFTFYVDIYFIYVFYFIFVARKER